ncbi:MAG TPA: DNA translocase FtsK [Armatimonadetes bacterium]|nr:DNA translocase FtsK [Armatimonadota bacterium]
MSIALIAAGLLGLAFLLLPSGTGVLGKLVAGALHAFAGRGALFVPLALLVTGALLLVDPEKLAFDEAALGICLLVVSYVSLVQVCGVTPGLDGDTQLRAAYGGWVGALVGGTLRGWVGNIGACILLVATALLALLLVLDIPLPDLIRYASRGASRSAAAVRNAHGLRARESEAKMAPRKSPFIDGDVPLGKPVGKSHGKKETEAPAEAPVVANLPEPEPEPEEEPEPEPIQPVLWNAKSKKEPEPAVEELPAEEPRAATKPAKEKPAEAPEKPAEEVEEQPEEKSEPEAAPREYTLPPTTLLQVAQVVPDGPGAVSDTARNIKILEETLAQFKIEAKVVEIAQGPTFTRYEIRLAPGIRVNRIESLGDNIAMNLAALDVRIQAPIPGKAAIGIEVPNTSMAMVPLRDVVDSPEFQNATSKLVFALGKDVTGRSWVADLARMPHLLIGGATNSGKSVCLNGLIASILFRVKPEEVKFLLVDPKRVELSLFDGIPHLLYPVITDIKKAAGMLNWAVREMERRYELLEKNGCRDIYSYRTRATEEGLEQLPFIVIVVDELADLMMQLAAEVEQTICRLAQLARATGIHLVIATQRPSVDVITGLIKANIPSRIAFAVSSHIDSRTILDKRGAERLLGRGDMLFEPIGASKPVRIQGAYVSEREIETLVEYLRRQATPVYTAEPVEAPSAGGNGHAGGGDTDGAEDSLFEDAVRLVVTTRRASTSMLQRKFSIGYTRAARLIDIMEERGIVSALDGAKPREVLASREQIEQFFRSPLNAPPEEAGDSEDESPFA